MLEFRDIRTPKLRSLVIAVLAATIASAVQTATASAQNAARDMQQAIANCISNYRSPEYVEPAFQQTGFRLGRDEMSKFAEKGDVWVYYELGQGQFQDQNACSIFTGSVPLRDAHAMALAVARQLHPNATHDGPPEEAPGDCLAVSVFAPRKLIVMRVFDNGNGGTCTGQDGSSIAISF